MTDTEIITVEPEMRLGIIPAKTPHDVIVQASGIAKELAKIVKDNKLSRNIQGREYVYVEGWSTMGAMLGVLPREVQTNRLEDGGYESTVELIRITDGAVIGRASALVGMDETWAKRPEYARRSMSVTRATGKAYRLGFSWIMGLAGYAPTPAEEMDNVYDAEYKEVKQEAPATTSDNGKTVDVYQAVVDAKLSENTHSAKQALAKCKTGYDTPEKAIAWMRQYRMYRDQGETPAKAAELANNR